MSEVFVQFSDDKKTAISAVFSCVQDENFYPNQGVVETTDARYIEFMKLFDYG